MGVKSRLLAGPAGSPVLPARPAGAVRLTCPRKCTFQRSLAQDRQGVFGPQAIVDTPALGRAPSSVFSGAMPRRQYARVQRRGQRVPVIPVTLVLQHEPVEMAPRRSHPRTLRRDRPGTLLGAADRDAFVYEAPLSTEIEPLHISSEAGPIRLCCGCSMHCSTVHVESSFPAGLS